MSSRQTRLGCLIAIAVAFGDRLPAAPAHTVTDIDQFVVTRAGRLMFSDDFKRDAPPPAAPNFSNGQAASYYVTGTLPSSNLLNGRLTLSSETGVATHLPDGPSRTMLGVRLLTNSDPANPGGLKAGGTFAVSGRFDLTAPGGPIGGYGVRLTDAPQPNGTAHIVQLFVHGDGAGHVSVRLQELDFGNRRDKVLADLPISLGPRQRILLTLTRPNSSDSSVTATYAIVEMNGAADKPVTVGTAPKLFDRTTWTRAEFFVFEGSD